MNKKLQNIINNVLKRSYQKNRKCFVDGCEKDSIMSHVLQKNGILDKIALNEHIYQVKTLFYPNIHYSIERVGLNKAFTFKGFCQEHDNSLFKEIEHENFDLTKYKSLLLFSYRAILKEYREKEVMVDFYSKVLNSSNLRYEFNINELEDKYDAESYLLWDLEYLMNNISKDLVEGTESFTFEVIKIEKLDICASAIFSDEPLALTFLNSSLTGTDKRLISCIIVNILPLENETAVIIGYYKDSELNCKPRVMSLISGKSMNKNISDLLVKSFSMWSCSETFYNDKIKYRRSEVLKLLNYFTKRNQFSNEKISINLFE